jgi:hypothetical protein
MPDFSQNPSAIRLFHWVQVSLAMKELNAVMMLAHV